MQSQRFARLLAMTIVLAAAAALAGDPDLANSTAVSGAAGTQVSVFTVPDGSGDPLSNCYAFGGDRIDATITVTLRDDQNQPVVGYPYSDLWLESSAGGLVLGAAGSVADSDTDEAGVTTFSAAIKGGGASDRAAGERTQVVVGGSPLSLVALDILYNSPDINGDLRVDLSDVVWFARDFVDSSVRYRCDFNFDGQLNLSDLALMAQGYSSFVPFWSWLPRQ